MSFEESLVAGAAKVAVAIATAKPAIIATQALVNGAAKIFDRICGSAAEQYGLKWGDMVANQRTMNSIDFSKAVEEKLAENKVPETDHATPRMACVILENASWVEDSYIRNMWAGLLASACTRDGEDDDNMVFVRLLGELTKFQARIIDLSCKKSPKYIVNELILPGATILNSNDFFSEIKVTDLQKVDRELDCLRHMGILEEKTGLSAQNRAIVDITPTSFTLHMYVRCQGSRMSPPEYFAKEILPGAPPARSFAIHSMYSPVLKTDSPATQS